MSKNHPKYLSLAPALSIIDPIPQFPAGLKALRIWCLWRYEEREGKKTKVPYQPMKPNRVVRAKSNDRTTWASFEDVCSNISRQSEFSLGIFADGLHAFIDLDKCIASDGTIEPWAQIVLCRTNSYAERSPSGGGLHIFVSGAVTKPAKINGCEIYSRARFFTVTGKHISGTPLTVNALAPDQLEELRDNIAQNQLRPYGHKTVRAHESRNGELVVTKPMSQAEREAKLERALSGDLSEYRADRSAAVHGALQLLARKHQGNREMMEEEFSASRLRADWGCKWERRAEAELTEAIKRWKKNGQPVWERENHGEAPAAWELVRFSAIRAVGIDWIWKGYLAVGKITMLNGEPGHGKSLVSLDIAARITKQANWPDNQKNVLPPSSVLLLTEEEDACDTIKPRFLAAGGNPEKLASLKMGAEILRIENHTGRLRKLIEKQASDTKLMILDPVSDYTAVDANKDTEVRPMLNRLKELAGELGIAVLGINHLNKKTDLGAIHRVAGARAWVSFARLNFIVGKTADGLRHLVPLKTNLGKDDAALAYSIGDKCVSEGSLTIDSTPIVSWHGKSQVTAADLTAIPSSSKSRRDEEEEWLRNELGNGEWYTATSILEEAERQGYSRRKMQRLAGRIKVERRKVGMPAQSEWRLTPTDATEDEGGVHKVSRDLESQEMTEIPSPHGVGEQHVPEIPEMTLPVMRHLCGSSDTRRVQQDAGGEQQ